MSLWIDNSESQKEFDRYIEGSYTADGDYIPSQFECDFSLDRFDPDYREAEYSDVATRSLIQLLNGCSNSDSLVPQFVRLSAAYLSEPVNSMILL